MGAPVHKALHAEGCLFCRRGDGGFRSREHIFSESLGDTSAYVLPRGVVCDRCNNGPLSVADHALTSFPPIELLRAERGIGGKAGKAIESNWGNASVAFTAPRTMEVASHGKKSVVRDGRLELRTGGPIPARTYRQMTRGVWKSALELIYWDGGPTAGFDPVFDSPRAHIIGLGETGGWMANPMDAEPLHDRISLKYQTRYVDGRKACPVLLDVFGMRFYTDLLRRDLTFEEIESRAPWEANVWVF